MIDRILTPEAIRRAKILTMNEEDFDSSMRGRPFETGDATRADVQMRRNLTLSAALWGRTANDLQRQLLALHPEIPSEFDLIDLRELKRSGLASDAAAVSSLTIVIGNQRFTALEARCEILRRAIKYLEMR